jgi:HEPN domain-containing protein
MEDIDAAIKLEGNIYTATHAQQAAEKLGRALLTAENSHVNTRQVGHRLDVQFDLIADENPFKARLSAHSYLEAYATTFRYPTPSGKMNRLDAKAAQRVKSSVSDLRTLIVEIAAHFEVDLDMDSDAPAKNLAPPAATRAPGL